MLRYAALLALVVWLGGMAALEFLGAPSADALRAFHLLAYACGGIMLLGLLAIKLIGPPPRAFIPRMSLVFAMLAIEIAAGAPLTAAMTMVPPNTLMRLNIALGLILLSWYARE